MTPQIRFLVLMLASWFVGITPSFAADDATTLTTQASSMDQLGSSKGTSTVTTKFATDFATLSGSQQNAEAIITGLRKGTPITLTGTGTTTGSTTPIITDTIITPPTKPMGYGNTYITMSLAQAELNQYGITQPTSAQLQAALTGGTLIVGSGTTAQTIQLQGILTQRASGMGWGQIANGMGVKLGQVISGMKAANKVIATIPTSTASTSVSTSSKGITGAGGTSHTTSKGQGKGITTASGTGGGVYAKDHGKKYGAGIVTAAGGGVSTTTVARGYGHNAGIVSGSGAVAHSASSGVTHGNSGNAPGQSKAGK